MADSRQPFAYGFVKSVISGDCLVLLGGGAQPGQAPPEKVVVLSGVQAPKFARSKNNAKDEPFAWESREFLRKMCIGKQVAFHTIAGSGTGREYANVFFNNENLAHLVVKSGFATVKLPPAGARLSSDKEELVRLQEEAKEAGVGIHDKAASDEEHIRNIDFSPNVTKLFTKYRGTPVPAVINQVRDGSTLRCELMLPSGTSSSGRPCLMLNLYLAGARSPRVPMSLDYRQQQHQKRMAEDAEYTGEEPTESVWPEFAREAVQFVETRLLNRDVHVVLQGIDMSNNVYGTVQYAKGNITAKLLETGLAAYVPWTAAMTGQQGELLSAARQASDKKLRLGAKGTGEGLTERKEVVGKVVLVVSGDTIAVFDGVEEKRVSLASVRAPRMGRRGEADAKCAMEAREFLRKRLIGKKARVIVEYSRDAERQPRVYATVIQNDTNIGVALVAEGLAEVIPHRQEEPRSLHYAKLMDANLQAKKHSKGIYSTNYSSQKIVDLTDRRRGGAEGASVGAGKSRAQLYLSQLKRLGVCNGVVEYCFSGSRLKVFVPKENCIITLALAGIKCPRTTEDCGPEALEFVRSRVLQHNVRLEVEACDKGDNFIGSLWLGQLNLGTALLEAGLGQLVGFNSDRNLQLKEVEAKAKEAKLGLWKNYVEPVVVTTDGETKEADITSLNKVMDVTITEIADAVSFYFQVKDDPNVAKVDALMAAFNEAVPEEAPEKLEKNMILAGLYSDEQWYRVKTEGMNSAGQMRVFFLDFGNHDLLDPANFRALSAEAQAVPGLARMAYLAGLKGPTKMSEHFEGAAITFNEVLNRVLQAKALAIDRAGKLHLQLTDPETPELSINQVMVRDGWCRVAERPERGLSALCASLKKDEQLAKDARVNIWEYGDVSDEEEDEAPRAGRFDGRTGKPITR